MVEPDLLLAVPLLVRNVLSHDTFFVVVPVERRARNGTELHELDEVGFEVDSELDIVPDRLLVVVLEKKDRRSEDADSMIAQFANQWLERDALVLLVDLVF